MAIVERPRSGQRFSTRSWLFLADGHERLVKDVAANIATLLDDA